MSRRQFTGKYIATRQFISFNSEPGEIQTWKGHHTQGLGRPCNKTVSPHHLVWFMLHTKGHQLHCVLEFNSSCCNTSHSLLISLTEWMDLCYQFTPWYISMKTYMMMFAVTIWMMMMMMLITSHMIIYSGMDLLRVNKISLWWDDGFYWEKVQLFISVILPELGNTHTHTHTHIYMYIRTYVHARHAYMKIIYIPGWLLNQCCIFYRVLYKLRIIIIIVVIKNNS